MILKDMGKRMAGSELFGQSFESGIYQDMLYTEVAKSVGSHGPSLGIAEAIYRDIMLKEAESL
jgi:Rod binding domain-containing protein